MITIEGLNKKQVAMLDKLWSIDTTEGIKEYRNTLCSEDQHMVDTLMEIIIIVAILAKGIIQFFILLSVYNHKLRNTKNRNRPAQK